MIFYYSKHVLFTLIVLAIETLLAYFLFAIGNWDLNIGNWVGWSRVMFTIGLAFCYILTIAFYFEEFLDYETYLETKNNDNKNSKKKKIEKEFGEY